MRYMVLVFLLHFPAMALPGDCLQTRFVATAIAGVLTQRNHGLGRERQATPEEEKFEKARQKAIRKSQYESLKKDTDQLLQLATELKQNVDKSSENTLSLEVINKAEEVEKLAKKVREKMKGY